MLLPLANMYGIHKQVKFLKLHHIDIQGSGHGVILTERKEAPIQVPTKYLTLDFCDSCGVG